MPSLGPLIGGRNRQDAVDIVDRLVNLVALAVLVGLLPELRRLRPDWAEGGSAGAFFWTPPGRPPTGRPPGSGPTGSGSGFEPRGFARHRLLLLGRKHGATSTTRPAASSGRSAAAKSSGVRARAAACWASAKSSWTVAITRWRESESLSTRIAAPPISWPTVLSSLCLADRTAPVALFVIVKLLWSSTGTETTCAPPPPVRAPLAPLVRVPPAMVRAPTDWFMPCMSSVVLPLPFQNAVPPTNSVLVEALL